MSSRILRLCLLIAATSACAAKAPASGSSDDVRAPSTRNRDLITQQDLDADPTLRAQSVLEVVRALRPQFLNDHGTNSMQASGMSDTVQFLQSSTLAAGGPDRGREQFCVGLQVALGALARGVGVLCLDRLQDAPVRMGDQRAHVR